MAIPARRRFRDTLVNRLAMIAFEINFGFDPVALAASYRLMGFGVRQVGDVCVTTGTKIFGVNGNCKFFFVHEQRNGFAGRIGFNKVFVAVAGETIRIVNRSRRRTQRERRQNNQ